jgi:uncharacterized protein YlxW (UPF0749 family)
MAGRGLGARLRRVLIRARLRDRARHRPPSSRLVSLVALVVAGFLVSSAAIAARGQDLRPNRNTDLIAMVRDQSERNRDLADDVAAARTEVDQLTREAPQQPAGQAGEIADAAATAALTPVKGPAVSITLTDAPLDVMPEGVNEDSLIVHQQDIQAVVNALWAGGAEAMTIQGQRVTSRTGVKCVGNVVVLHGIPYAPPYVIVAIGDQRRMEASLASSRHLTIYRQYAEKYGLGYAQRRVAEASMDGYKGTVVLNYATAKPS